MDQVHTIRIQFASGGVVGDLGLWVIQSIQSKQYKTGLIKTMNNFLSDQNLRKFTKYFVSQRILSVVLLNFEIILHTKNQSWDGQTFLKAFVFFGFLVLFCCTLACFRFTLSVSTTSDLKLVCIKSRGIPSRSGSCSSDFKMFGEICHEKNMGF